MNRLPFSSTVIALVLVAAGLALSQISSLPDATPPSSDEPGDVRSFGAVGDGQADDAAAIQRAVDAGVGLIRLPRGVYRLSRPIVIDLDRVGYTSFQGDGVARLVMAGAGPALRFQGTHFKSADPAGFGSEVWDRQRMPCVDGLAISGEHDEAIGIEAAGTMQLTVTRTHIRDVLHAIHLVENNRNVLIADCHLYENRGIGIYYDAVNLHQSNVSACHISYCRQGGIVSRAGNVRNIHITGCDLESNMSPDTPATANVLLDCTGSPYGTGEVAITGCTIQHNNPSPDSANIRILGGSQPSGARPQVREGNVAITGNVLSDVQVNLHLKDCRGICVTGNTFWQGYRHNLLIEECSSIIVGPNNFDRNPRYNYGNAIDAKNSLLIRNSEDCTLTGLHIAGVWRDPAGLTIENCRRFHVSACTILDCDNAGLLLREVRDSRIADCLIRDDRPAAQSVPMQVIGGGGNEMDPALAAHAAR